MAVVDPRILAATANLSLSASPYATNVQPLDISPVVALERLEQGNKQLELQERNQELTREQMQLRMAQEERMLKDAELNRQQRERAKALTYVEKITNLPIPSKYHEQVQKKYKKYGIDDLFDPNNIDITATDAAKKLFDFSTDPDIRKWIREGEEFEAQKKQMQRSNYAPNFGAWMEEAEAWWNADPDEDVPFPTIADKEYVDWRRQYESGLRLLKTGQKTSEALSAYTSNFFDNPIVQNQIELERRSLGGEGLTPQEYKQIYLENLEGYDATTPSSKKPEEEVDFSPLIGSNFLSEDEMDKAKDFETSDRTDIVINAATRVKRSSNNKNIPADQRVRAEVAYDTFAGELVSSASTLVDNSDLYISGYSFNNEKINPLSRDPFNSPEKSKDKDVKMAGFIRKFRQDGLQPGKVFEDYNIKYEKIGDKKKLVIEGDLDMSKKAVSDSLGENFATDKNGPLGNVNVRIVLGDGNLLIRAEGQSVESDDSATATTETGELNTYTEEEARNVTIPPVEERDGKAGAWFTNNPFNIKGPINGKNPTTKDLDYLDGEEVAHRVFTDMNEGLNAGIKDIETKLNKVAKGETDYHTLHDMYAYFKTGNSGSSVEAEANNIVDAFKDLGLMDMIMDKFGADISESTPQSVIHSHTPIDELADFIGPKALAMAILKQENVQIYNAILDGSLQLSPDSGIQYAHPDNLADLPKNVKLTNPHSGNRPKLHPQAAKALEKAYDKINKTFTESVTLASAYRTPARSLELELEKEDDGPVAKPFESKHNSGLAIDLSVSTMGEEMSKALGKALIDQGWKNTYGNHYEFIPTDDPFAEFGFKF